MPSRFVWLRLFSTAVLMLTPGPGRAQSAYISAGLGPTFDLEAGPRAKSTYRTYYGAVGFEWPNALGLRLEGAETYGFLWVSGDLTYRVGPRGWWAQPYGLVGAGFRLDLSDSDPIGTLGVGVRMPAGRPVSLFAEGRLYYVLSVDPNVAETRPFLPLTFGLIVGF